MKYLFIINPESGSGKKVKALLDKIDEIQLKRRISATVIQTKKPLDATEIAYREAKLAFERNEEISIYVAGGDGTLNEVVNGVINFDNVRLGIIPIGSGNDFVRSLGKLEDYFDLNKQLEGKTKKVDIIKLDVFGDDPKTIYGINSINMGFDGNSAILAHKLKKFPFISGAISYIFAVILNLILKKGANLKVYIDDNLVNDGRLLMLSIANGKFCVGGVCGSPKAVLDDGKLDILMVKNISRLKFLNLYKPFKEGKIFDVPSIEKIITHYQTEAIKIEYNNENSFFVLDGEMIDAKKFSVSVMKKKVSIIYI